jgi:cytochrome c556
MDPASPDLTATRTAAGDIATKAKASSSWFPAGTGPEAGKTGAKPDIWKNPQDFSAKLAAFQSSAEKFYAAALAGDPARLKASGNDLAGTCKACHDKYRMEMHH